MIKKFCKYCQKESEFKNTQQFAAHVRNCEFYPNRESIQRKILEKNKAKRKKYIFKCSCGNRYKSFLTESQYRFKKYKKYCSSFCAHSFIKRKVRKSCTMCDKIVKKNADKFCSRKCMGKHNYEQHVKKWQKGELSGNGSTSIAVYVRRYIFEKYDNKCVKCDWDKTNKYTNKIPLQIHHIDGNRKNTIEKNLILLCPNCHSLTNNYGGHNKIREKNQSNS